jgi:hypothetical protein
MQEDRRAHERIDSLEKTVKDHLEDHSLVVKRLDEISENTSELVMLVKGVKGVRGFVLWLAPMVAALTVVGAAMAGALHWMRGH